MEVQENKTYFAQEINDEFSSHIAPVSAMVAAFSVTGIFGNLFVLYVHIFKYQSCNFRYFVLGLCAVDLTTSLTILPMEVYTQLHWFIFPSAAFCKLKSFLHVFLSVSTVYVLLLIAIDRHRKVCYPYSWQMTSRSVLKGYAICFLLTCVQSWTVIMRYSRRESVKEYKNTLVTVYTCTHDPEKNVWRILYIVAMVPHFLVMAIMLVLYCLVGRQVFGYVMKMRQQSQFRKRKSRDSKDAKDRKAGSKQTGSDMSDDCEDKQPSSSIIDNNLCEEINATAPSNREVDLVAYKVQENGIMFEKGSSIKRKGNDVKKVKMTFEEKKKMEERSTNMRVSRVPDDAISGSHHDSSKACSIGTSESDTDKVKEESTSKSSTQPMETTPDKNIAQKERLVKRVSLAERLTTRVRDLGQRTVNKTKKKVRFSGKARDKLRRRTLITFVFTTIFIVTTIMYLVISGEIFKKDQMSYPHLALMIFFYRLYFINSVIHPIIYGLLDPKFRKTLKQTTKNVIESVRSRHDPENKEIEQRN